MASQTFSSAMVSALSMTSPPGTLADVVKFQAKMVEITFERQGGYYPTMILLDEKMKCVDMMMTEFTDQTDKYLFWRIVADRVRNLNAFGMVWIAESWIRNIAAAPGALMRNLPIIGEQVHILAIDKTPQRIVKSWVIEREPPGTGKPTLRANSADDKEIGKSFFLVPVIRALGLPDSMMDDKAQ